MKRHLLIIATLFFCFTSFAQVNKLLRQANKSIDLNEKIDLYSQVIALDSKNLDAYFFRALAKNDLGDYHGAIVDYSKIILLDPDADTYFNRGNSRYSIKDYEGAKEDYRKAFELDKSLTDALYSLGCVNLDLGEFIEAIKDFNTLITLNPLNPKLYYQRAQAYQGLQNHLKALEDYSRAITVDPSADTYYNRGVFLLNINYYQRANDDFTSSLKLNNNNSYAYFYRGATHLFLGEFIKAISDFEDALSFDAMDFDALLGLAMSYQKINDLEKAKFYFDKASNIISPNQPVTDVEALKNTYWHQNQFYYLNDNFKNLQNLN